MCDPRDNIIASYGLLAVPASASSLQPSNPTPSTVPISSLYPPNTPLASRINSYAKRTLPPATYNHSMRVYSYGVAIARECFPEWNLTPGSKLDETYFITAMLHDIGTTPQNIGNTRLSYEFWAGVEALRLLLEEGHGHDHDDHNVKSDPTTSSGNDGGDASAIVKADKPQAESIAEAIFRHQDVQDKGNISLLTQLIQLGTLLDNIGAEAPLKWVTLGTINEVNQRYDRDGWGGCFRDTVVLEKRLKPYAMVSRIVGFEELIMQNEGTT